MELTERRRNILTGAISALVLFAAITVGVKAAFGAFEGGYTLEGRFSAAGQGLIEGSDVKIHGVNIGEVSSVHLADLEAVVRIRIHDGVAVPVDTLATIRPKTLFGEKFIDLDPGDGTAQGPFLDDGDEIARTEGGFELEQVLSDTFPLLQAIDGGELATVLTELASAGQGLGEAINRSIVNSATLNEVFADNVENTRQFLGDLANLSEQLGADADEILRLADAANLALPTLNEGEDRLVALLEQAGRLATDAADLLEGNAGFVEASLGDGSDVVQLLFDRRNDVVPLVIGLRQYVQSLSEIVRIETGDGSLMGAVKGVLGGDLCGVLPCPGVDGTGAAGRSATGGDPGADPGPPPGGGGPTLPDPGDDGDPDRPRGVDGITSLLRKVLGA